MVFLLRKQAICSPEKFLAGDLVTCSGLPRTVLWIHYPERDQLPIHFPPWWTQYPCL